MKKFIITAGFVLLSTAAFAGATLSIKSESPSNGSEVGKIQSHYTGNGAIIGGNGDVERGLGNGNGNRGDTYTGTGLGNGNQTPDQTTSPGSRAAEVHGEQDHSTHGNK